MKLVGNDFSVPSLDARLSRRPIWASHGFPAKHLASAAADDLGYVRELIES